MYVHEIADGLVLRQRRMFYSMVDSTSLKVIAMMSQPIVTGGALLHTLCEVCRRGPCELHHVLRMLIPHPRGGGEHNNMQLDGDAMLGGAEHSREVVWSSCTGRLNLADARRATDSEGCLFRPCSAMKAAVRTCLQFAKYVFF